MKLHTQGLQTFEQMQAFVEGSQALGFELTDRSEAYVFVAQTLRRFGYARCGAAELQRFCAERLGRYKAPREVRLVSRLPKGRPAKSNG